AGLEAPAGDGATPLLLAITSGKTETALQLIAAGAQVNAVGGYGRRQPVHHAAAMKDASLLRVLVVNEADLQAVDDFGFTPLHYAAGAGNLETVRLLLERKVPATGAESARQSRPRISSSDTGHTPLHFAVLAANREIIEALLAAGADIHTKNRAGKTPLALVTQSGSYAYLRLPPNRNTSVLRNQTQRTELAKFLREHGAKE
ncbi:MAG: ankyrin repeat domain-containing protein, partial [Verrucomicrobia bacterium]|nr:ankyrin repeat domain-containing protein [Verrucomicrobiota bacterium]